MRHLNYTHLLYFWTVVREGGVAPAAAALHITPQTVSGQIKLLEDQLQGALLERQGRRLVPTDLGRLAYTYAEEIFPKGLELASVLRGARTQGSRAVAIGVADAVPKLVTFRILEPLLTGDGHFHVTCHEAPLPALMADLAAHRLDLVLATSAAPTDTPIKAFSHLCQAYQVNHIKACATSAMRDAKNSADIIRKIRLETGISIEIISGEMEASLVYENHVAENMSADHSYLYIDVGGGSTELSFFNNGQLHYKHSFNIGTIRLIKELVSDNEWDAMKEAIKSVTKSQKKVIAIGSGGNINKIFSLSKKKDGKPLNLELLRDYYKELDSVSLEEHISQYKLRSDRADVIVPALLIYINAMRWAGAEEIYVPKIGLADGLIRHLWEELNA